MIEIGYLSIDNPIVVLTPYRSKESKNGSTGLFLMEGLDLGEVSAKEIEAALDRVKTPSAKGLSVLAPDEGSLVEAAELARRDQYLLELDLRSKGKIGEDSLISLVKWVRETGAALSLRLRPDSLVGVDVRKLKEAGLDILHLDLSAVDGNAEKLVKRLSDARGPVLMVGGKVGDFEGARSLLSMGADLVSLESPDPEFAEWLSQTMKEYAGLIGWYNAPKHICSGGDLRGLSFCCPPVKNCPVMGALKKMGMSPKEFVERKLRLAEGTPLQYGDGTCFGSLVWCCKITKPCFMRDAVLHRLGLSGREYMVLKKKMADELLRS